MYANFIKSKFGLNKKTRAEERNGFIDLYQNHVKMSDKVKSAIKAQQPVEINADPHQIETDLDFNTNSMAEMDIEISNEEPSIIFPVNF
jgi:hypothetical protein